jgi:prepilin-type N-terminal cleavage/methylation domain-containing protein
MRNSGWGKVNPSNSQRTKMAHCSCKLQLTESSLQQMHVRKATKSAFSLMELIAVVVILGVVAALVLPRVVSSGDVAKEKACSHNRAEIGITVERYYMHNNVWPANDLSDIGADVNYFPEGVPACPVSGEAYRLDPFTHRVLGHTNGNHQP